MDRWHYRQYFSFPPRKTVKNLAGPGVGGAPLWVHVLYTSKRYPDPAMWISHKLQVCTSGLTYFIDNMYCYGDVMMCVCVWYLIWNQVLPLCMNYVPMMCAQNVQRAIAQVRFNLRYWLHCHSNFRITRTKIENLRWQVSEDINFITYRKFVTSLVQKLKKKCVHKLVSQGTDYKSVYSHFLKKFFGPIMLQSFQRLPE